MHPAAVTRGVSSPVQVSRQVGALKRFRAPASGSPFVAQDVAYKEREEFISQLHGLFKEFALPPTGLECAVDLALRVGGLFGLGGTPQEDEALVALGPLEAGGRRSWVRPMPGGRCSCSPRRPIGSARLRLRRACCAPTARNELSFCA